MMGCINVFTKSHVNRWLDRRESATLPSMLFSLPFFRLFFVSLLLAIGAAPALAQDRLAYVIGNGTTPDGYLDQPAADALAVSQALLGLGFDVIRREDVSPAALPLGGRAAPTTVLYFSGRTQVEGDRTLLMGNRDKGWPVIDTAKALRRSGAEHVLVLVENCSAGAGELAEFPTDRDDLSGIFFAFSAEENGTCVADRDARFTDRVLAMLATPDMDVGAAFAASSGSGRAISALHEPLILLPSAQDDTTLSVADLALLSRLAPADRDRMRALWVGAGLVTAAHAQPVRTVQNDVISFGARVEPVTIEPLILPQAPLGEARTVTSTVSFTPGTPDTQAETAGTENFSSGIQIFDASPSQVAAQPVAAGLPQPSVIVGRIQTDDPTFVPTLDGGVVTGTAIDTSSFEARKSVRTDDATLYAQLVNSGAFDPGTAPRQLETALQIELKRMGCYTSTIDGVWGNGSAGAVDRYFQQIGETPETRDPTIGLFRKIVLRDEVVCPEVRQATRAAPQTTTRTTATPQRQQQRRTTRTRQTTQTRPQPTAPSQTIQIKPNIFGTGIRG